MKYQPMELREAIEKRQSIRHFTDDPVPAEDLKEVVRRAGLAPSVNNSQPWKFIVIRNKKLLLQMAEEVGKKIENLPFTASRVSENVHRQVEWFSTFFREAPAFIGLSMETYETVLEQVVQLSHEEINRSRNYPDLQSAGAAVQNILLSAVELGYGACWMSGPLLAQEELEKLLNIKPPWRLVTFIAIGKTKTVPSPRTKKPLDQILEILD